MKHAFAFFFLAATLQSQTHAQTTLYSSDRLPLATTPQTSSSMPAGDIGPPDTPPATPVTNAERTALRIDSTLLDLHLIPAQQRLSCLATLTLRNTSAAPLTRLPLQLSGSLRWLSVSAATGSSGALRPISFTQSPVPTDTDHTGQAQEAVLTLPAPLASGATLRLSVLYGGPVLQSSLSLTTHGIPAERADAALWDAIVPTTDSAATSLRGFGSVLWYPVAAPLAILGDGNNLLAAADRQRALGLTSTLQVRLTVEYEGDPPVGAILNGRLLSLAQLFDTNDQPVDRGTGVATAGQPTQLIGFRTPSLFLTAQQPVPTPDQLITLIGPRPLPAAYAQAASEIAGMLTAWLGPNPAESLLLLDHQGLAYEEGSLLVAPIHPNVSAQAIAPELVRGLTHAWFPIDVPHATWLDQGLPQFTSLLWTERTQGREAALAQLTHSASLIALQEPDFAAHPDSPGHPLLTADSDIFLRLKASAVLWQLREILGEQPFQSALQSFRRARTAAGASPLESDTFEHSIERSTGQDLAWFFSDWVDRDRGLPDLTIVRVDPRPVTPRNGVAGGTLVAVTVRNDGDCIAEVPVTVRSVNLTATERLRVLPHQEATTRVLFGGSPESVQVNDGSTPETSISTHTYKFN